MFKRNREMELQIRQSLQTIFAIAQMTGGIRRMKLVADFASIGNQVVTNDWDKVEWGIDLLYTIANTVKPVKTNALTIE